MGKYADRIYAHQGYDILIAHTALWSIRNERIAPGDRYLSQGEEIRAYREIDNPLTVEDKAAFFEFLHEMMIDFEESPFCLQLTVLDNGPWFTADAHYIENDSPKSQGRSAKAFAESVCKMYLKYAENQ